MTGNPPDDDFRPEQFRPGRRSRFKITQTAQWALLMTTLSDPGYRVYSLMRAHVSTERDDDTVWPSQKTLAEMLNKRPEAVSRVINKELVPLGLVDVEVERYGANRSRRRNVYTVHEEPPPGWEGYASIQEWYAARKERETAGQPGHAKNRVSGDAKDRASGDAKDRVENYTNGELDERGSEGGAVRPSVQVEDARASETDGRTDAGAPQEEQADGRPPAGGGEPAAAEAVPENGSSEGAVPGAAGQTSGPGASTASGPETTPGMEVLTRVGRVRPELAVAGKVLSDQAWELDKRIADSEAVGEPWRLSDLVVILSAPLDGPIRRSAGAVIAARIRTLPRTPRTAMLPTQATSGDQDRAPAAGQDRLPSSTLAAERDVTEAITRRMRSECPECGADSPGGELCGRCQGWPECDAGCGRVLRGGGTCETCQYIAHHAAIAAERSADGACPGHGGEGCGRPVMTLGLCARCRIKAEDAKRAADAEWEAAVARTVAAVEEAEAAERDPAPF